jgi:ABC-type Fe3+ transport system substrate-binding protein
VRFQKHPLTPGIDLFGGGGNVSFDELEKKAYLDPILGPVIQKTPFPKNPPCPLASGDQLWAATALSSFGIFYNRILLDRLKIPTPGTWEDLAQPIWKDQIALSDPRRSSSSLMMFLVILKTHPWDKAWAILGGLAANSKKFTLASSDPVSQVVQGEITGALSLDYYAIPKVAEMGEKALGFIMPKGKSLITPDPIGILKGAPNPKLALQFVEYVLSQEGQRLLILQKGSPRGPSQAALGRMAVYPEAYQGLTQADTLVSLNPFLDPSVSTIGESFFKKGLSEEKELLQDLLGAIYVDRHSHFRELWSQDPKKAVLPPLTEKEYQSLTAQWSNPMVRQKHINNWL